MPTASFSLLVSTCAQRSSREEEEFSVQPNPKCEEDKREEMTTFPPFSIQLLIHHSLTSSSLRWLFDRQPISRSKLQRYTPHEDIALRIRSYSPKIFGCICKPSASVATAAARSAARRFVSTNIQCRPFR